MSVPAYTIWFMSWPYYEQLFHGDAAPRAMDWQNLGFDASLPLLEVGPGLGTTTIAMAQAFPTSHILAVEPDADYREILEPALQAAAVADRVDIIPSPIADVMLPPLLGGVAIFGVLYFMTPASRAALWAQLAKHLPTGGLIVTESGNGPNSLSPVPLRNVREAERDGLRYERWCGSELIVEGEAILLNEIRAYRGDDLVKTVHTQHPIFHLPQELREQEIADSGYFDVVHLPGTTNSTFVCARRK